ncbi:MAG: transposase, partial [Synechococcales bacterium]|nr:transposase [Synechococcales bacterium]
MQEIVAHTCEKWSSQLTDCNGESDHVHLVEISKVVNTLKTVSSRSRSFPTSRLQPVPELGSDRPYRLHRSSGDGFFQIRSDAQIVPPPSRPVYLCTLGLPVRSPASGYAPSWACQCRGYADWAHQTPCRLLINAST